MKKIYTLIICVLFIANLPAQDAGDLDLSYGTDGISVQSFLFQNIITDISIMSDDKIISGGSYYFTADNLLSFKFDTDGSLDSYNLTTWFEHDFDDDEAILATFVLPDDKILLAGYYGLAAPSYFLIQLTADGYLDPSFGVGGISSSSIDFIPRCIDVYYGLGGEYSIFLGGSRADLSIPCILKIDKYGDIVNSFGNSGIYEFIVFGGAFFDIYVNSFAGSGQIYACGYEIVGNNAYISKHNIATGDLINSFADDGHFGTNAPNGNKLYATALVYESSLSNSTISVFGNYVHADIDMDVCAFRLNTSDGSLDGGFGVGGWSMLRVATSNEYINDALMQNNDKYYFGGYTDHSGTNDFFLGRLQDDGNLDLTFGENGLVTTDIQGDDHITGLVLNDDQSRVYGGGTSSDENTNRAGTMACYYTDFGVGIDNNAAISSSSIKTYPNPAREFINIEVEQDGLYEVELYTMNGMLIKQESISGKSFILDIQDINKGIYLLKVHNDNILMTQKVAKH